MNSAASQGSTTNSFRTFWDLGYQRLVPIVPPDAEVSEHSSLIRRLNERGKAVGIKGRDGYWRGFDWLPYETDEQDVDRWHAMGAGVGIKTGRGLILIDADTLNVDHARIVKEAVERRFGQLPIRVGRYPKAGYLLRLEDEIKYCRIEFGELDDKGRLKDRVEILSDGRQFVASGTHATTGKPYTWPRPIVPYDALPRARAADVTALLEELRPLLPAARPIVTEGGTGDVNQEALKGDLATVRKAVEATPNTSEHFPTRESYRDFGYAIKAALPDHPDEAFELFAAWCARWTDGDNDPGIVEADWKRMKPPFKRGANWLYELAEQHSAGAFQLADAWFAPIEEVDDPFAPKISGLSLNDREEKQLEPIRWIAPGEWADRPIPPREWEVEGWIPRGEVTLLYGDGGIGKTLLAHQYATAAAAGLDWLGQKTRQARVMCFFCEDSEDELQRRQTDINAALGVSLADTHDRLRIASRKFMDNLFILWDRNTGAMKRQAIWELLLNDAKAFKADVVIVDTIADTYGGSEIDRGQVNAFVKSCLGRIAFELGGSVIALGHPSMAGKTTGSGTSGSTAWSNAARSRLYLRMPKGVETGNVRELEGMKLNYGPKGARLKLRWNRGAFEVLAGSVPASGASAPPAGAEGGAGLAGASFASLDDAAADAVAAAVRACAGVTMSMKPNSGNFAPRVLKRRESELLAPFTVDEVEAALLRFEKAGAVRAVEVGRNASRHPTYGLEMVEGRSSKTEPSDDDIFG
jgi:hypothetical protein